VGTSSGEWSWVLPDLARNHLVYAVDLPGYDGSYEPPDYSPAFTASFVNSFLEAVGVESAVVVGNSFGGLVALHLALSEPARVSALVLSDSAGLGQAVNPALVALSSPGGGELAKTLGKTRLGAAQRSLQRALLLFLPPLANTLEVGQGPVQAGTAAKLYGRNTCLPAQRRRRDGATRGVVGPSPSTADADTDRVGDRGQVASLLSGKRGDRPRARGLPRTHL
jgi:pimeloyl-ACP methyl ester carboxylesterase